MSPLFLIFAVFLNLDALLGNYCLRTFTLLYFTLLDVLLIYKSSKLPRDGSRRLEASWAVVGVGRRLRLHEVGGGLLDVSIHKSNTCTPWRFTL